MMNKEDLPMIHTGQVWVNKSGPTQEEFTIIGLTPFPTKFAMLERSSNLVKFSVSIEDLIAIYRPKDDDNAADNRKPTLQPPTNAIDLLDAAAGHMRDRAATYDKPEGERSMGKTVAAFNAITERDLSESEGWLFMQVLKDVRDRQRKDGHRDSLEDGIAYSALKAEARLGGR